VTCIKQVLDFLSKKYSCQENGIHLESIKGSFGSEQFKMIARVYSYQEEKNLTEASSRKQIEKDNSFLIGKKAICVHIDNPNPVECVCTAIIALDDYSSVKPLFSRNGKKYIIETYEWIK
jgi:hypothetical protein